MGFWDMVIWDGYVETGYGLETYMTSASQIPLGHPAPREGDIIFFDGRVISIYIYMS